MTDPIYEQKALIYKALAHPIRVQVVEFLADGEKCVCDIVKHLGTKEANTSRHLGVLKSAGVLETRKNGLNVYYKLHMPCLLNMFSCVEQAIVNKAEYHSEIAKRVKK